MSNKNKGNRHDEYLDHCPHHNHDHSGCEVRTEWSCDKALLLQLVGLGLFIGLFFLLRDTDAAEIAFQVTSFIEEKF